MPASRSSAARRGEAEARTSRKRGAAVFDFRVSFKEGQTTTVSRYSPQTRRMALLISPTVA